jgi:uncharacterized protein (TIGR02145 family)
MLCPLGWHVPTDADWTTLITNLGGVTVAGGRMKETGNTHWMLPNTSATNTSGFSGLPGGYRYNDGTYFGIRYGGHWWSSVENDTNTAWDRALSYDYGSVDVLFDNKRYGFSVRCMKD